MGMYFYKAKVTRVVDGDTLDIVIDLGFRASMQLRVRLARIDTAEMNSKDPEQREKALRAASFLASQVEGKSVYIKTSKSDLYGRWLAEVYLDESCSESMSDRLLSEGLAKLYGH